MAIIDREELKSILDLAAEQLTALRQVNVDFILIAIQTDVRDGAHVRSTLSPETMKAVLTDVVAGIDDASVEKHLVTSEPQEPSGDVN